MIYFYAKTLNNPSGGARAGTDFIHALLHLSEKITVVSNHRFTLPSNKDNVNIGPDFWLMPPDSYPIPSARNISVRGIKNLIRNIEKRLKIKWMLTRYSPDLVIHNGFPIPGSTGSEMLDLASCQIIIIHSSPGQVDFFRKNTPSLTREGIAERIRGADLIIFVTRQIKDSWTKISGVDSDRTTVISNTTREEEAERLAKIPNKALREELDLKVDDFIVACVGKVDPAKGQDLLIKAIPGMVKVKPSLHVVFVGPITSAGHEIISKAERLGVSQHCSFVGSHESAYPYIRTADMLIHPSRGEGQGMIILEAMILGTPVLATRVGGVPFNIEHKKSGWLVPPDDHKALISGFRELASDPSLMERIVRQARSRYWKMFSRKLYRTKISDAINNELNCKSDK